MTKQVPKLIGSDAEFTNYVLGRTGDTCLAAVRLLLSAMPGVPAGSTYGGTYYYQPCETDMDRRYFVNGCAYNDSCHLEMPTAEVLSAERFVNHWRAVLSRIQEATKAANSRLPADERLCVHASNSDGFSHSWASHLNVLMTREGFDTLFRKPRHFLWLASYQVTSQIFTGSGKACSENGAPPSNFQLSQRGGDFFEVCTSWNTMMRRGLLNERDEAHAGRHLARLHCIYYDSNLSDFATCLKVGALQLVVAMLEAGWLDAQVYLEDPVEASQDISHSLGAARVRTLLGDHTTALDIQRRFHESAVSFVEAGFAEDAVPGAERILALWGETLDLLHTNDLDKLSCRLDWVAKLKLIGRGVEEGRFQWGSHQARMLDLAYSNLDPDDGLFFRLERAGLMERLTEPHEVSACLVRPEPDTRAYTRGRLLDLAPDRIVGVDWDFLKFLVRDPHMKRMAVRTFDMSDPLFWSERNTQHVFDSATGIEDVLNKLDALRPEPVTQAIEVTHDKSTPYAYEQYQ